MLLIAHRSKTVVQAAKLAYLGKGKVFTLGTFKEVRALLWDFDEHAGFIHL